MSRPEERLRVRRKKRRTRFLRWIATALLAAAILLFGIAIGRALADGPSPGGTRTSVRTLEPKPLEPAAKTVTVTVSP